MKKLIAMLLLAGFLCVNLVGCSGSTTKTSSGTGSASTATKGKDSK